MRQLISIVITVLLLPLLAVECEEPIAEEPPYELPPITQEGANTFGCLINGEVVLPYARPIDAIRASYPLINRFDIIVLNQRVPRAKFNFRLIDSTNIWEGQRFDFTKRDQVAFDFSYDACQFVNANVGGQIVAGELFVSKYNIRPEFISGTFWFTAVSDCDTVFVTEGRFDLPFTR